MEDKEKCGKIGAGILVGVLFAGVIGLFIYFMLNQEDNGPTELQAGMTDEC
jgi:hypothetical protein